MFTSSSFQVDEDVFDVTVRAVDGYINATKLTPLFEGRRLRHYQSGACGNEIRRIAREHQLDPERVVETQINVPIGQRATWVHPALARWLIRRWRALKKPSKASGIVYLVTSPVYNAVKAGKWTGTPESLFRRYRTVLTGYVSITFVRVEDCAQTEREFKDTFKDCVLDSEVFKKESERKYLEWLSQKGRIDVPASGCGG